MADFSALIAQIEAYVKQNGNNEITGNGLQSILVGMVNALGTVAITALQGDLADEVTARQNADGTLQQGINTERQQRQDADGAINAKIPAEASSSNKLADKAFVTGLTTALQNAVNAIKADIENGYVYAGIATPSGTPVSGRVFYLARQAGTYTNFGGLTLTEGVNILKYNGTAWSQEQLISIADIYKNPLIGYYECDTAGGTAAKTVAATGYVLPTTGGSVKIKMANRNTVANATLNINSTCAKPLFYNGVRAGVGNTWDTNEIVEVFYDGTNYQAYNVAGSNGDGVFDISTYNLTNGQPTPYVDLEAALGTNGVNIPESIRKGGMSVKFIQGNAQSSDNNYVQYRYMGTETTGTPNPFLDTSNWQGVDDEPTTRSENLVKSGGVFNDIYPLILDDKYNSKEIFGSLLVPDSFIDNAYVKPNRTIQTGFPDFRVSFYKVITPSKLFIYGKSKGNYIVVSKWNSEETSLTETILSSTQNDSLIDFSVGVELSENESLCITERMDSPTYVRINDGLITNLNNLTKETENMFATSIESSTIDGKYISSSNTLIVQSSFFIKTFQLIKGYLYKVHIRYASGGYQDVAALYTGSVADSNFKKWLIRNPNDNVLHTYDFVFIAESDNDILAITQHNASNANLTSSYHVQEIQLKDNLEGLGDVDKISNIDKTIFGDTITLDSIIDNAFLENQTNSDPTIRTGFPNYRILYYTVTEETKLYVEGKIKGSRVVVVSVWNSDKSSCISKKIISNQNIELLPYYVTLILEPNQYLAITELTPNNAEIRVADGLKFVVNELKGSIIPSLVLDNAAASADQQTSPDFSSLSGKTWNAVGDSVTAENKYPVSVASRCGLTVRNCGLASSTIAINNTYLQNLSIVERVLGLNGNTPYADADIWTIFGGINDILYETPLGKLGDTDNTTLYGALSNICAYIRSQPNNPKLILITPYQLKTLDGEYQKQLTKAILQVAKVYSCPVIDLYNEGGICHTNINNVLRDGVHPKDPVGNNIINSAIASGILRNC